MAQRTLADRINSVIYDISRPLSRFLQRSSILIALIGLGLLLYNAGFPLEDNAFQLVSMAMDILLAIFAVEFFLRWLININRLQYIKEHWWRGIMASVTLIELLVQVLAQTSLLGPLFGQSTNSYSLVLQGFLAVYSISWLLFGVQQLMGSRLRPSLIFAVSFVGIALLGATLLTFPEMTTAGSFSFIDAFFTATSATCVTGLIVVDTASFFTFKGQLVILLLMQIGGIGIIAFASFFVLILRQGFGVQQQLFLTDVMNGDSVRSSIGLIRPIILYTLGIELVGAILIYIQLPNDPSYIFNQGGVAHKAYYAIFHSVSAFCNAGFSLFPESLMNDAVQMQPGMLFTFAILIITGGIGFPVLRELFSRQQRLERKAKPWMRYSLSTYIALVTSGLLILVGWVLFFGFEENGTLSDMPWYQQLSHAFFQSVTTRTAGFNSVDIGAISQPTLLLFLFLMMIGGSSGGTAGGIKTTTFVLLMQSVASTIRGQRQIVIRKRAISTSTLYQAVTIFAFAIVYLFVSCLVLLATEPHLPPMDVVFEAVSAFATVGLSRGVTADISSVGQVVLIISMFIGRVGVLTIAFALSRPTSANNYRYPEGKILIG